MKNIFRCFILLAVVLVLQFLFIQPYNMKTHLSYDRREATTLIFTTDLISGTFEMDRFWGDSLVLSPLKKFDFVEFAIVDDSVDFSGDSIYINKPVESRNALAVVYASILAKAELGIPATFSTGDLSYDFSNYLAEGDSFTIAKLQIDNIGEDLKTDFYSILTMQATSDLIACDTCEVNGVIAVTAGLENRYLWCRDIVGTTAYVMDPLDPENYLATFDIETGRYVVDGVNFKLKTYYYSQTLSGFRG